MALLFLILCCCFARNVSAPQLCLLVGGALITGAVVDAALSVRRG